MTLISTTFPLASIRPRVWMVGTSFVLLQFFLQLSSGVVIGSIMHDMHLSALTAGILSSSFYIIYTALQIPVGIVCDRKNPRPILAGSALLCSLGCVMFAASYSLPGLFIGRSLIGIGSACAFVGLTHLIRQHYPIKQFAFLIGISETLSFLVTVLGIIGMGRLIVHWGWRDFINTTAIIGVLIAYLCWRYIPNETKHPSSPDEAIKQLREILSNKLLWINGLFIGLTFSLVTVFGALWAAPFLQVKLGCSMRQASLTNALFFLGTGVSCPLFGILSTLVTRRKPLIIASCLLTAFVLLLIMYIPTQNISIIGFLMLVLGLSCGAYILAYPISNELASKETLSTCAGFTNTLALITTPLLQPFVGYLLSILGLTGKYTLADYQTALLVLPCCIICACGLVCFLPEKNKEWVGAGDYNKH
ncbi:MAG: MFS transporter [Legionellaceae bacterium]|nr:MFS transporter [Legionellaceae bacterium]